MDEFPLLLGISIHAPLAGSDLRHPPVAQGVGISIHAPLAGSDMIGAQGLKIRQDFNPRSPCGERHACEHRVGHERRISIHAPLAGSDFM